MVNQIYKDGTLTKMAKALYQNERKIKRLDGWFIAKETERMNEEKYQGLHPEVKKAHLLCEVMRTIPLFISENAILVSGIERACAVYDEKNQEIVVFVKTKTDINLRKFNVELKKYLPKYMLPSKLFVVDDFPYNQNNKIDRITLKNNYLTEEK